MQKPQRHTSSAESCSLCSSIQTNGGHHECVIRRRTANRPDDAIDPIGAATLPKDLVRLRDWLQSHAHESIQLERLADIAGVKPRTLEVHCRQFLRVTPLAWVRRLRLMCARKALLDRRAMPASRVLQWTMGSRSPDALPHSTIATLGSSRQLRCDAHGSRQTRRWMTRPCGLRGVPWARRSLLPRPNVTLRWSDLHSRRRGRRSSVSPRHSLHGV